MEQYISLFFQGGFFVLMAITLLMLWNISKQLKALVKTNIEMLQTLKGKEHTANIFFAQQEAEYKSELQSYTYLQALAVRDAVYQQTNDIYLQRIENAPKTHGLTDKELSTAFTSEQIDAIYQFWQLFHQYLQTHWLTEQGKFKTIFRGSPQDPTSEVGQIIAASKKLVTKLDELLTKMKQQ